MTGLELDSGVRQELRALPPPVAKEVARHLVMAGRLLEENPEEAFQHALTARRRAPRLAATREAAGLASYHVGRYAEALSDFRAARRISGSHVHWPLMADCERGLGRPERAIEMAGAPEARSLDRASRVEMRLVAAGARRDLGQLDAAIVTLQIPELRSQARQPWIARLRYAYADTLLAAGRYEEARDWFAQATEADPDGLTDAADRLAEIDGLDFTDALADGEESEEETDEP